MIQQAATVTWESTREFEQYARDVGMAEEFAIVYLVLVLN